MPGPDVDAPVSEPDASSASGPSLPVARVAVDVWLPHLDRFFDYRVPASDDAAAQPGVRVRVRFAGRLLDGFVIERCASSGASGPLAPLNRVVSPEQVLTPDQVRLVREVADHYAGTFADVVRLAVPPRHAATEKATPRAWPEPNPDAELSGALATMPGASGFLDALERGDGPRAFWQVPVATGGGVARGAASGIVDAVVATLRAGRGAIVLVPDVRDVRAMCAALGERLGQRSIAELHSGLGPSARYRNYLAVLRGTARVVVGTRAAAFAPMHDLGLVAMYDDGDDLYDEPRAPYFHARTVAALRAAEPGVGLLLAAHARTCEAQAWLERGWLAPIALSVADQRRTAPAVVVNADSDRALERDPLAARVRLPEVAFRTIRAGLAAGPVLVQVPRSGYLVGLRCAACGTQPRCPRCKGVLRGVRAHDPRLDCAWCGLIVTEWSCVSCGSRRLRAPIVGAARTTEELGRAFPGVRVVDSSAHKVVEAVDGEPALVVATPGAEPVAEGGYSAAVLLDANLMLAREDLRASEEAVRRWLNAMALVRTGADGGSVCLVGPVDDRAVRAVVRADPGGFAERELVDRRAARFPPAWRVAQVDGTRPALRSLLDVVQLPASAEVLGPVDLPPASAVRDGEPLARLTIRADAEAGRRLAPALKAALAVRSARKDDGAVRVRIDPCEMG